MQTLPVVSNKGVCEINSSVSPCTKMQLSRARTPHPPCATYLRVGHAPDSKPLVVRCRGNLQTGVRVCAMATDSAIDMKQRHVHRRKQAKQPPSLW